MKIDDPFQKRFEEYIENQPDVVGVITRFIGGDCGTHYRSHIYLLDGDTEIGFGTEYCGHFLREVESVEQAAEDMLNEAREELVKKNRKQDVRRFERHRHGTKPRKKH